MMGDVRGANGSRPSRAKPAQRCATLMSEARSAERMLRIVCTNHAVPHSMLFYQMSVAWNEHN